MIFLLYWVGYAAAVGTAACYAAYKTALVQRTLAVALRRSLRGLMHDIADQSENCTVVSTGRGVDLPRLLPTLLHSEQSAHLLLYLSVNVGYCLIHRYQIGACQHYKGCA